MNQNVIFLLQLRRVCKCYWILYSLVTSFAEKEHGSNEGTAFNDTHLSILISEMSFNWNSHYHLNIITENAAGRGFLKLSLSMLQEL